MRASVSIGCMPSSVRSLLSWVGTSILEVTFRLLVVFLLMMFQHLVVFQEV
uniref:Uncharacterized protein n=1 Tax=Picea glauca TaxID=3330 RepID=A0A101M3U3_PICGL|nr:hypothetical protein ABT39_MTgene405 [Picea glauca]QHR92184.1 hypothetical protein Q903MT_gene6221 [Picea sitchensis]